MAKTFTKQTREVVDYDLNMIDYFDDLTGDYVETVVIDIDNVNLPPLLLGPEDHPH